MLTYRFVFAVAKHYLKNDEDIYDAIQDTYTRVYKNLTKLNDPEAFAYWLRKIAENCSKTILNRQTAYNSYDLDKFEEEFISKKDPFKANDITLDITEMRKYICLFITVLLVLCLTGCTASHTVGYEGKRSEGTAATAVILVKFYDKNGTFISQKTSTVYSGLGLTTGKSTEVSCNIPADAKKIVICDVSG